MTKDDAVILLDKLAKWKAIPAFALKRIGKEIQDAEKLMEFLPWLKTVTEKIRQARDLVPEHMWDGYTLLQVKGLQEQDIFYAARKELIEVFKNRYPFVEKKK